MALAAAPVATVTIPYFFMVGICASCTPEAMPPMRMSTLSTVTSFSMAATPLSPLPSSSTTISRSLPAEDAARVC